LADDGRLALKPGRTRDFRSTVDADDGPTQRAFTYRGDGRPRDSCPRERWSWLVVLLIARSLGRARACILAVAVRAILRRARLSRPDGPRSVKPCAAPNRPAS